MPDCGIDFVERKELLTYEEMLRVLSILREEGIKKLRITGGEPFVRKGSMEFLEAIQREHLVENLHITTNATLTEPYLDRILELGLKSVNISLDTLDRDRFIEITKRDQLSSVLETIDRFNEAGIRLKVNMVVMQGLNEMDLISMAHLAKDRNIEIRFIEEMPFNGHDHVHHLTWNHKRIHSELENSIGKLIPQEFKQGHTAQIHKVEGWKGSLGIIAAYSRTFCGSCNRLRITPTGLVKTCLYDKGALELKPLLRGGYSDEDVAQALRNAVSNKAIDGFAASKTRANMDSFESMASIGG